MTIPIGSYLKGLSLAAILLSVPAFAVFGLLTNNSHRSSVELSAEHDPLRNGFRFAEKPKSVSGDGQSATTGSDEGELPEWKFTVKPVPSPTPPGYTFP